MAEVVGATHRFHEAEYAEDWARRFTPTPERLHLFETILQQLQSAVQSPQMVILSNWESGLPIWRNIC